MPFDPAITEKLLALGEYFHLEIDALRSQYDDENKKLSMYREYARGQQADVLTVKQKLLLNAQDGHERADNVLHGIVNEHGGRLSLDGFDVGEADKPDAELNPKEAEIKTFGKNLYVKSALPDLSGEQFYNAIRDGNAPVFVKWIPARNPQNGNYGRSEIILCSWWDGEQGVWMCPETDALPAFTVSDSWAYPKGMHDAEGRIKRRFVYFDDRILRFESASGAAKDWEIAPQALSDSHAEILRAENTDTVDIGNRQGSHIQPWLKEDGSPLHAPFVQFANADRMRGSQGLSIFSGGGIASQDDINVLDATKTAAGILTGFQILVIKGIALQNDVNNPGQKLHPTLDLEPGMFLLDESKEFDAKAIAGGDTSKVILSASDKVGSLSRNTQTPRHTITGGDWPSGEALGHAEQPTINAAKRRKDKWEPAWGTVVHRAIEQANAFSRAGLDEDILIIPKISINENHDAKYEEEVRGLRLANDIKEKVLAGEMDAAYIPKESVNVQA